MTALAKIENQKENVSLQLVIDTYCKGATPEEALLFSHICKRTGLDPAAKQIYAVKRKDSKLGRDVMTIQTGIDGYRLIAERTGCYCPGREPSFSYDKDGKLVSATAYVKKMTRDGTWHEISATAFYKEYVQLQSEYVDGRRTGKMVPNKFWETMEHGQLAKCAETLVLRKGFPADLSGLYTHEEMAQASNGIHEDVKPLYIEEKEEFIVSKDQYDELMELLLQCSSEIQKKCIDYVRKEFKIEGLSQLPACEFIRFRALLEKKQAENQMENSIITTEKENEEVAQ